MKHSKLPWETLRRDFVPSNIKFFLQGSHYFFVAWRKTDCVVFGFFGSISSSTATTPQIKQNLRTSEEILDIVDVDSCAYLVNNKGFVQSLHLSAGRAGGQHQFCLIDTHHLSPLRKVIAVCGINRQESRDNLVNFCAVTVGKGSSELHVELYVASCKNGQADFKLSAVYPILLKTSIQHLERRASVVHCSELQVNTLFPEYKALDVLLLGLSSGHLFSIPHNNHRSKDSPSPRLVYLSPLAIQGVHCPSDGNFIIVAVNGGVFVTIAASNQITTKTTQLRFNVISLPCPITHVCAFKSNMVLCSNGVDAWILEPFSADVSNHKPLPVKGVTASCKVYGTHLIVVATMYCMFYELDSSDEELMFNSLENSSHETMIWTGLNLDKPLTYLREMKEQTEMLALLHLQQEREETMIAALSTAARGTLLEEFFSMSVKVDVVSQAPTNSTRSKDPFSSVISDFNQEYCISVEICNTSSEEFNPPIWGISIEIANTQGKIISIYEPLTKPFYAGTPFLTTIPITLGSKDFAFPMKLKAYLLAVLTDVDCSSDSQWLTISMGGIILDVSYFVVISTQVPQWINVEHDVLESLGVINPFSEKMDKRRDEWDRSKIIHSISIPETARHNLLILSKLLQNCCHRIKIDVLEKHLNDRNTDHSIWLGVHGDFVQLTFRKSCLSLVLSSINAELLHLIKSWVLSVVLSIAKNRNHSNGPLVKAKNLEAVLQMQHFEQEGSRKHLLTIYEELRNAVSSELV